MKVLVIADIHGRKFWRETVANNIGKVDKVVFLGDYLDPYKNEIAENPKLMECNNFYDSQSLLKMLEDIVSLKKNEPDKYILLTGNHTDSYIWSRFKAASRTDYTNWEKYHKFFLQNLSLFNLVWVEDNVIFSHAGISEGWAKAFAEELSLTIDLNKPVKSVAKYLSRINLNNILDKKLIGLLGEVPRQRGGWSLYGSCEWADLKEHIDIDNSSVDNIVGRGEEGTFQVFGHTQLKKEIILDKWACLDCRKGFIIDTQTHEITEC